MKKLVIKILVFGLLAGVVLLIMSYFPLSNMMRSNYYYKHVEKLNHLRETKSDTAKRIVFIGGSGITFGIDSKMIADSLGTQVYNTSVHGGFGADYSIISLKEVLTPGRDILVIGYEFPFVEDPHFCTEPRIYADYFLGKPLSKQLWFNSNPLNTLIIWSKVVLSNFLYTFAPNEVNHHPIFRLDGFNEYGDIITHLDRENKASLQDSVTIGEPSPDYAALIKDELGAFDYYIISPPVKMYYWETQKQALYNFDTYMQNNFGDHYLLDTDDSKLNDNDFYQPPYHLSKEGRRIHSLKIIEVLKGKI